MSFIGKYDRGLAWLKEDDRWLWAGMVPVGAAGICWFVYRVSTYIREYNPTIAAALAVGLVVGFMVGRGWELFRRRPTDRRRSRR